MQESKFTAVLVALFMVLIVLFVVPVVAAWNALARAIEDQV